MEIQIHSRAYMLLIFAYFIPFINASLDFVSSQKLSNGTTAVARVEESHIRAKRQWGGFGGCCFSTMMCCNMPMPMPIPPPMPPPMPIPVPVPAPVPHPVPMPMPMPMPVPVPIHMSSCCSCCMPVCMSGCMRGGCGGGYSSGCYGSSCGCNGMYGRRKRETLIRNNVPAVRHQRKQITMIVRS